MVSFTSTLESECAAPEAEIIELLEPALASDDENTRERFTTVCGYRIGKLVARGGMSVVFEVTRPPRQETLAMKVVVDQRLQTDLAAHALHRHAARVAAIASPHIVRTIDAGRLPSGEPFVVMEKLEGEDLAAHLREHGPLPLADAIRFAIEACDGLAAAHAAGIVHGDIKPANLVFAKGAFGTTCLKIVDFAPSVPRACDPDDPLVTCTPGYASPEQLGARPDVDGRTDVFALGAVLYELLTGKRAFEATTLPEMSRVAGQVPPSMKRSRPDVPAALETIVLRCIARDREARYATVRDVRAALAALEPSLVPSLDPSQAAITARRRTSTSSASRTLGAVRSSPRTKRVLFLTALFPASAVVSMTLVRLVLATNLLAAPPASTQARLVPEGWPPPAQLAR